MNLIRFNSIKIEMCDEQLHKKMACRIRKSITHRNLRKSGEKIAFQGFDVMIRGIPFYILERQ
jgi:hypothetical protein